MPRGAGTRKPRPITQTRPSNFGQVTKTGAAP